MVTATYLIEIDTAEDGSYATNVSARVLARSGLMCFRGVDQLRHLSPPRAGFIELELNNSDAVLDIGTTTIAKGQNVRLKVTDPTTTTVWPTATGIIDTLTYHPERTQQSVGVSSMGVLVQLNADHTGASTALYSSIDTGAAIGHLLDAVGWPAADRVIDTGQTVLDWWWLDESEDPFGALRQLIDTEGPGAVAYEDASGKFVFRNRHAAVTESRSLTIQTTFRGATTAPVASEPFLYDSGERDVINYASMTRRARSAKALASAWTLGEALNLAPAQVWSVTIRSGEYDRRNVPFTAAVVPVLTTDYTLTSGSIASMSLDRTSGSSAILTITAGSGGAVIATGLQVRAQLVSTDAEAIISSTQSVVGVKKPQPGTWGPRADVGLSFAQELVNALVAFYTSPRPIVEFPVFGNSSATAMTACLSREIGDRIRVISTSGGIDVEAYIQQLRHYITAGPLHRTTFGVESFANVGSPAIVGTTLVGSATEVVWF